MSSKTQAKYTVIEYGKDRQGQLLWDCNTIAEVRTRVRERVASRVAGNRSYVEYKKPAEIKARTFVILAERLIAGWWSHWSMYVRRNY